MLQPDEREKLERGFAEGEASLFLSGMKPTEFGYSVMYRILGGEITVEQGRMRSLPIIVKLILPSPDPIRSQSIRISQHRCSQELALTSSIRCES